MTDIRSSSKDHSWVIDAVNDDISSLTLTWETINIPEDQYIYLVSNEENIDMKSINEFVLEGNEIFPIEIIGTSKSLSIQELSAIPEKYFLYPNYPNPFNPETHIEYDLPNRDFVRLEIFDLKAYLFHLEIFYNSSTNCKYYRYINNNKKYIS